MSDACATLVNGEPAAVVSAQDRGLAYGDGVFETVAVRAGQPLLWSQHIARLRDGLKRLGIRDIAESLLAQEAQQLCAGQARAVLKIIVTRGISGRGYRPSSGAPTRVLSRYPWPQFPAAAQTRGVTLHLCETRLAAQPRLAGVKHLNRLEQVLARAEWGDEHAEGLMRDDGDRIVEGTMSNVFMVRNGQLLTPDLTRCGIAGVLRAQVCARVPALLPVKETSLTLADLLAADEIFLTNSLIGIWPVTGFAGRSYTIGPVTRQLQVLLEDTYVRDDSA
jgi:4-amino-4-deoxychorismate lyase